jgi:hypothetical protein
VRHAHRGHSGYFDSPVQRQQLERTGEQALAWQIGG